MTDTQLYSIGAPMLFNAVLIGLLMAYINAKLSGIEAKFEGRFTSLDAKVTGLSQRFDDLRDLWKSELNRVEGILDARMTSLEGKR
jgi:hypothetical protein